MIYSKYSYDSIICQYIYLRNLGRHKLIQMPLYESSADNRSSENKISANILNASLTTGIWTHHIRFLH
jgi:hypothetical protein